MKLVFAIALILFPTLAHAQYSDDLRSLSRRESAEHFNVDFRVGPYEPDARATGGGDAFDLVFGGDRGPMLGIEFDGFAYRIPYVGMIGIGLNLGWARYKKRACSSADCSGSNSDRPDSKTNIRLWPVAGMLVLRLDGLAREFGVPIILTPKIGIETIFYTTSGGMTNGNGRSVGMRWSIQAAVELDFINRARARALDEEWGINHTAFFLEFYGSTADSQLDVSTNFAWALGLSMTF